MLLRLCEISLVWMIGFMRRCSRRRLLDLVFEDNIFFEVRNDIYFFIVFFKWDDVFCVCILFWIIVCGFLLCFVFFSIVFDYNFWRVLYYNINIV